MESLFINLFLILLPLGELLRYQTGSIAINAIDIVSIFAGIFVIVKTIQNKTYLTTPLTKPIFIFILVGIISLIINIRLVTFPQLLISSLYLFRWIILTSFYFLAIHLPKTKKKQLPFLVMTSGFVSVVFGILQLFLYPDLRNLRYLGWDEHYLRIFGTFFDPNFTGILYVFTFIVAFYFLLQVISQKNKQQIFIYSSISLITCVAIFLTYSRGALLAFAGGIIILAFQIGYKKLLPFLIVISSLFVLFIVFLTNTPTEAAHLLRINSSVARLGSDEESLIIFSHYPIFGIGFDTYRYVVHQFGFTHSATWNTSHAAAGVDNSLLFVLVTTGIIGLISYCYLLYCMIINSFKKSHSLLVLSSLCSWIIGSLFINALFYPFLVIWMWIFLGFIEKE